jgi:hypothetical protein
LSQLLFALNCCLPSTAVRPQLLFALNTVCPQLTWPTPLSSWNSSFLRLPGALLFHVKRMSNAMADGTAMAAMHHAAKAAAGAGAAAAGRSKQNTKKHMQRQALASAGSGSGSGGGGKAAFDAGRLAALVAPLSFPQTLTMKPWTDPLCPKLEVRHFCCCCLLLLFVHSVNENHSPFLLLLFVGCCCWLLLLLLLLLLLF